MKWLLTLFLPIFLYPCLEDPKSFSRAYGYYLEKGLQDSEMQLDLQEVILGMQQALQNQKPSLSKIDYLKKLTLLQKTLEEKKKQLNLQEAKQFLQENALKPGVCELEKEKLQYIIKKPGQGLTLKEYHHPLVNYKVSFFQEEIAEDQEKQVLLVEELIPALRQGILGMKEGEKRTIFVHPELTQEKATSHSSKLMIIEIELLEVEPKKGGPPFPQELALFPGKIQ